VGLICLDLQRARLSEADERMLSACHQVLSEARRRRWPVLHVHRREGLPEAGRPIPGLEPLPTEPVFVRPGPSAFSHRAFAQAALALGGPLALIGFSMADSVLATAFAAADRELAIEVVRDAVATGAGDPASASALFTPIAALAPLGRMLDSKDLFREDAAALLAANAP
jgi:hypothetical protein